MDDSPANLPPLNTKKVKKDHCSDFTIVYFPPYSNPTEDEATEAHPHPIPPSTTKHKHLQRSDFTITYLTLYFNLNGDKTNDALNSQI